MSAKVITFDLAYIGDQMSNIQKAHEIIEEAMQIIRKANQHRNWKCKETSYIENALINTSNKLNPLNLAILEAGQVLGEEFVSFAELEQQKIAQVNALSENLQKQYGFSASNYGSQSEDTNLPVTQVPNYGKDTSVGLIVPSELNVNENTVANDNPNFLVELGRFLFVNSAQTVGAFACGVMGIFKGGMLEIAKFLKNLGEPSKFGKDAAKDFIKDFDAKDFFQNMDSTGKALEEYLKLSAEEQEKVRQKLALDMVGKLAEKGYDTVTGAISEGTTQAVLGSQEVGKRAAELYESWFGKSSSPFTSAYNSDKIAQSQQQIEFEDGKDKILQVVDAIKKNPNKGGDIIFSNSGAIIEQAFDNVKNVFSKLFSSLPWVG